MRKPKAKASTEMSLETQPERFIPMSEATNTANSTMPAKRGRKPRDPNAPLQMRKPAEAKRIFALVQVLDEDGNAIEIPRGRVNVISFEKDAEEVLVKLDDKEQYPNAVYLTGLLPPGR